MIFEKRNLYCTIPISFILNKIKLVSVAKYQVPIIQAPEKHIGEIM